MTTDVKTNALPALRDWRGFVGSVKPEDYVLTDEQRAMLPLYRDKYMKNTNNCDPMTEEDKRICTEAVMELYVLAELPLPKAVVFVESPLVLRYAAGYAGSWWWQKRRVEQPKVNDVVVADASLSTEKPEREGCNEWYYIPWLNQLGNMDIVPQDWGHECARSVYRMWQGGNTWSGFLAYAAFFLEQASLDIDWAKFHPWRELGELSGPRAVHDDYVMISDRPAELHLDENGNPHCETGPHVRWRDGSRLYCIHGTRVPAWIVEYPEQITVDSIMKETNAEIRRIMIDRFGLKNDGGADWYNQAFARQRGRIGATKLIAHAKVVDETVDEIGNPLKLYRLEVPGDEAIVMVRLVNSTPEPDGSHREYFGRVPPTITSAFEARNWRCYLGKDARFEVQT